MSIGTKFVTFQIGPKWVFLAQKVGPKGQNWQYAGFFWPKWDGMPVFMIEMDRYDGESPDIIPWGKIPYHTLALGAKMTQNLAQNGPNSIYTGVMLDSKSVKGIASMIYELK